MRNARFCNFSSLKVSPALQKCQVALQWLKLDIMNALYKVNLHFFSSRYVDILATVCDCLVTLVHISLICPAKFKSFSIKNPRTVTFVWMGVRNQGISSCGIGLVIPENFSFTITRVKIWCHKLVLLSALYWSRFIIVSDRALSTGSI